MKEYLLKYLLDNENDAIQEKYIKYFKIELDWYLYNYGDHINKSHIRTKKLTCKEHLSRTIQYINTVWRAPVIKKNSFKNILSSVYSMSESSLINAGFNSYSSILQPLGLKNIIGDKRSCSIKSKIENVIKTGVFNDLYNSSLFSEIEECKESLKKLFLNYDLRALMTYTGQYYSSKILIDIFKEIERPSLIFSHGLPGIYSSDVDNNSDYLMVWGEKIKDNYVKKGFNENKIRVVGNPLYVNFELKKELRNSLENVLVIPCSSIQWHQHEWGDPVLIDRNSIILYLYQVQNALEKLGVKHARVRPHPAISKEWLSGFIDNDFYLMDYKPLAESLSSSSLVIGAPSTTFLEAIIYGVNYVLYNPDFHGFKNVPPFDGSEEGVHVAKSEEELMNLIKDKNLINPEIIEGYIRPLDLSCLNEIIH